MSANEYYSRKPLPDSTGTPYTGSSRSPYSTPAPPYSSQPHLAPSGAPSQPVSRSPFETAFDDHVYPASSDHPGPTSSHHRLSHPDTAYRGLSPVPSDDMAYSHRADDIPLRDHAQQPPAKDAEMQDHVYDAPQPRKPRRGRVRFGELGMLRSNGNKIPFVVYFFTLVQVAVFIGEIVKNGAS